MQNRLDTHRELNSLARSWLMRADPVWTSLDLGAADLFGELILGRGREVVPCGAQSRNKSIALRNGD
jgi:hypothetical protein